MSVSVSVKSVRVRRKDEDHRPVTEMKCVAKTPIVGTLDFPSDSDLRPNPFTLPL